MLANLRTLTTSLSRFTPSFPAYYSSLFPSSASFQAFSWPTLALETVEQPIHNHPTRFFPPIFDSLMDCLWFAVPKRKVTPGKKRMKTTLQNRIKTKSHVIVDRRTGELTLRHRLPWNWKDYLPENLQGKSKDN